jgi:hypothetical protein
MVEATCQIKPRELPGVSPPIGPGGGFPDKFGGSGQAPTYRRSFDNTTTGPALDELDGLKVVRNCRVTAWNPPVRNQLVGSNKTCLAQPCLPLVV